jgi:disulfide bond formation protein DsbB
MATATPPAAASEPAPGPDLKILWTRLALFIAAVGVLGSLHLSINMGLQACPFCYYQRTFMMAAAGVLLFAMFLPGVPSAAVSVLALTPASAGLGIAVMHVYIEWTGGLECPNGISGVLVAPQESLLVFALLVGSLVGDLVHRRTYLLQGLGAMLLGVVFCLMCLKSVQRTDPPTAPYKTEVPDGCRKPFVKKEND